MSESFNSPANKFLQSQVYSLGEHRSLTDLPPGPERDFLTLTWGPLVFRTTYAPGSDRLFPLFLRVMNEAFRQALPSLDGSPEQLDMLQRTYSSKVFQENGLYADADPNTIREAFRDWKISLGLPRMSLPVRLRMCLMVDDESLADFTDVIDLSSSGKMGVDHSRCRVKLVESLYPQERAEFSSTGWMTLTFDKLLEAYTKLQDGNLSDLARDIRTIK